MLRRRLAIAAWCGGAWVSALAWAGPPAGEVLFARSNGDLKEYEAPGKFGALNVLDGNPDTAWCSEGTGQEATLEIQLLKKVSIDRMEIAPGVQAAGRYKSYNRPKEMDLVDGDTVHPIEVRDRSGRQVIEFDPALSSDRLVLKFKSVHKGENRHTCIADLVLYRGKTALNGGKLTPLRGLKERRSFLDGWVAGSAYSPNRELVFGLNDTYRFVYVPSEDADESIVKTGSFKLQGDGLQLKDGKEWVPVVLERDDAGRVETIKIEAEPFSGSYSRRTPSHFH